MCVLYFSFIVDAYYYLAADVEEESSEAMIACTCNDASSESCSWFKSANYLRTQTQRINLSMQRSFTSGYTVHIQTQRNESTDEGFWFFNYVLRDKFNKIIFFIKVKSNYLLLLIVSSQHVKSNQIKAWMWYTVSDCWKKNKSQNSVLLAATSFQLQLISGELWVVCFMIRQAKLTIS